MYFITKIDNLCSRRQIQFWYEICKMCNKPQKISNSVTLHLLTGQLWFLYQQPHTSLLSKILRHLLVPCACGVKNSRNNIRAAPETFFIVAPQKPWLLVGKQNKQRWTGELSDLCFWHIIHSVCSRGSRLVFSHNMFAGHMKTAWCSSFLTLWHWSHTHD